MEVCGFRAGENQVSETGGNSFKKKQPEAVATATTQCGLNVLSHWTEKCGKVADIDIVI